MGCHSNFRGPLKLTAHWPGRRSQGRTFDSRMDFVAVIAAIALAAVISAAFSLHSLWPGRRPASALVVFAHPDDETSTVNEFCNTLHASVYQWLSPCPVAAIYSLCSVLYSNHPCPYRRRCPRSCTLPKRRAAGTGAPAKIRGATHRCCNARH